MSSLTADLFVEDRAHEEFVKNLLSRIAQVETVNLSIQIRSARGGHPVVLDEFRNYQKALLTALLGDSTALQPLTQFILAKTERNPFFMEEMVQTLVDQGVLRREPAGGMQLVAPVTSGALAALHPAKHHRAEHYVVAPRCPSEHQRPSQMAHACHTYAQRSRLSTHANTCIMHGAPPGPD